MKLLKVIVIMICIAMLGLIMISCGNGETQDYDKNEKVIKIGDKEYILTVTTDEQAEKFAKEAIYARLSDPSDMFYKYCNAEKTDYKMISIDKSDTFAWNVIINATLYDKQGQLMCNVQYDVRVGTENGSSRGVDIDNIVWDEEWAKTH